MRSILGFVIGLGAGAYLFGMQARNAGNCSTLPAKVGDGMRDFGSIAFKGLAMGTGIVLAGKLVECLVSEAKKR